MENANRMYLALDIVEKSPFLKHTSYVPTYTQYVYTDTPLAWHTLFYE